MRKPIAALKSRYYAENRRRLLDEAKRRYREDPEGHYRRHKSAIKRGIAAASKRRRENRAFFIEKLGGCCIDCGYSAHPSVLQFDHCDPTKKGRETAALMTLKDPAIIWVEVQKCVLRCANCHVVKSLKAREGKPRTRGLKNFRLTS